jgi:hypothetical protein
MLVAMGMLTYKLIDLRFRVNGLESENTSLRHKLELLASLESDNEVLRSELKTVKPKLEAAEQALTKWEADSPEIRTDQAAADASAGENAKSPPSFMRMMESDEAVEAGAKMQVNMQYGIFFADLKLPGDVEDEVRAILSNSMMEQIRASVKAMQDGTMKDFRADHSEEATTEALRVELSKVLNADEMAIWEEYEANKGYYMLEQSYDMQLGMYAPSMSRETRDTVKQVMAEEMTLARPNQSNANVAGGADWMSVQTEAMDRSLERLVTVLSEEEFTQVERFIQQQNEAMQASQRMMQSMMGTGDEAEETP